VGWESVLDENLNGDGSVVFSRDLRLTGVHLDWRKFELGD